MLAQGATTEDGARQARSTRHGAQDARLPARVPVSASREPPDPWSSRAGSWRVAANSICCMACPYLGRRLSLENIAVSRSAAGGDSRACTMTEHEDGKGSDQGIYPKSHRGARYTRDAGAFHKIA